VGIFEPIRLLRRFSVEQNKAKAAHGASNGTANRVNTAIKQRDDVMEELEVRGQLYSALFYTCQLGPILLH
jgi:hypothetical protein